MNPANYEKKTRLTMKLRWNRQKVYLCVSDDRDEQELYNKKKKVFLLKLFN